MLKKILFVTGAVLMIAAVIGWETLVAIHDRTSRYAQRGSLFTFLDLLGRYADTGKRAQAAYDKGDFTTARRLYQGLAERGNKDAMLRMAVLCARGQGGPVDNAAAVKWFRAPAEAGNREAQFGMGLSYDRGSGVPQDYAEAVRWYQKAAQQGVAGARVNLGIMYLKGHGVAEDPVEAQKWFILAGNVGKNNRTILAGSLSEDQRAEARKRAAAWQQSGR